VLCENTAGRTGLLGEQGLSFYIEDGDNKILFDTGAGYTLLHNSQKLNIPLSSLNYLALSHGHYDHTGGMKKLLKLAHIQKVFAHPNIFQKRYVMDSNGEIREIGYRGPSKKILSKITQFVPVISHTNITKNISISGPIPRIIPYEKPETHFFMDIKKKTEDPFEDDQCLIIETKDNYIILLGCCHSGVINTLSYLRKQILSKTKPIILMGGLHLSHSSIERLYKTVEPLPQFNIQKLYLSHCSGFNTLLFFNNNLNISCLPAHAGFQLQA